MFSQAPLKKDTQNKYILSLKSSDVLRGQTFWVHGITSVGIGKYPLLTRKKANLDVYVQE